jgi:hypothetical protein
MQCTLKKEAIALLSKLVSADPNAANGRLGDGAFKVEVR